MSKRIPTPYVEPAFDADDPLAFWPQDYVEIDLQSLDPKTITQARNAQGSTARLRGGPWVAFMGNFNGLRIGSTNRPNTNTGNMVHYPVGPGSVVPFPRTNGSVDLFFYQETAGQLLNYGSNVGSGIVIAATFSSATAARMWCASGLVTKRVGNANSSLGAAQGTNNFRDCVQDSWIPIRVAVSVNVATIQRNPLYTCPNGQIAEIFGVQGYVTTTTVTGSQLKLAINSGSTVPDASGFVGYSILSVAAGLNAFQEVTAQNHHVLTASDVLSADIMTGSTGTGIMEVWAFGFERQAQ